ncbi:MAG: DUF4352 domain-containing protein [Methanospirillaceae archaeon]|nr:DUF4352 domain-containing protein [Methanospirillaceae archaeon]
MRLSPCRKKGIILIIILLFVQTAVAEPVFTPVPTRPLYVHEYRCDNGENTLFFNDTTILFPGTSALDSVWNCTVRSVLITDEIQRTDNEFDALNRFRVERFTPDEGYLYLIITVDLQNHGDKEYCFDSGRFDLTLNQTKEQYTVSEVMDFLPDPFPAGNISPDEQVQGSIAFMVPYSATGYDLGIRLVNRYVIYLILPNAKSIDEA